MSAPVSAMDHVGDAGGDARDGDDEVPGATKGLDHHLDPGGELVYGRGVVVDQVQVQAGQEGVVVTEAAGERLGEGGDLGALPPLGQIRQHGRVTLAVDERLEHGPPGHPADVARHRGQLDAGILELQDVVGEVGQGDLVAKNPSVSHSRSWAPGLLTPADGPSPRQPPRVDTLELGHLTAMAGLTLGVDGPPPGPLGHRCDGGADLLVHPGTDGELTLRAPGPRRRRTRSRRCRS